MKLAPSARRLGLMGVALSLTLVSAAWLFFGTRAEADVPAVAAPAVAAPAAVKTTASKVAPAKAAPAPAMPAADSAPTVVTVEREQFAYATGGRRDPFRALISTSVIRPLPSELRLVAVVFDPSGAGSVAILRDLTAKTQHRVRAGQLLGRMRVAQIRKKDVVFTIEELGYSRQEILALQDSTATRVP